MFGPLYLKHGEDKVYKCNHVGEFVKSVKVNGIEYKYNGAVDVEGGKAGVSVIVYRLRTKSSGNLHFKPNLKVPRKF